MGRKTKPQLVAEYKALTNEEPNSEWTNAELEAAIEAVKLGVDVDEDQADLAVETEETEETEVCYLVAKGAVITARGKIYEGDKGDKIPVEYISDPEKFKKLGLIE